MSARHVITASALCGSFLATVLPQTSFLEKYRKLKSKYRMNQTEEPLHEKCKKLFEQVLDDVKLSDEEKKLIRPFHAYGYNIFSAGTLINGNYGAVVGIPMNYIYEDVNSINKFQIHFNGEDIDWSKKSANDFLNSITLSENAQKYAIAREVLKVKNKNLRVEILHLSAHVAATFVVYSLGRRYIKVIQTKRLWRFLFGLSVILAAVAAWVPEKKEINLLLENIVDEKVSKLGPEYIEGAIEYYDKLLNRNKALKSLLNDTRKKPSVYKYENVFLLNRGATLSERKEFFNLKNMPHT